MNNTVCKREQRERMMREANKNQIVLADYVEKYNYNVQIVRLVCAILVIISHAHPLGDGSRDFLNILTNKKVSFGSLAVHVLFYLSGLYICRSFLQKKCDVKKFVKKRVEKLWWPLFVVIFISVFVIGPLFTSLELKEYYCESKTWKYFLNLIFILQYELPGVFEKNIYNAPAAINGALWTLPLEILCYFALMIALKTKILSKQRKFFVSLIEINVIFWIVYFIIIQSDYSRYEYHLRIIYIFFMGVFTYLYADQIKYDRKVTFVIWILFFCGIFTGFFEWVLLLLLPNIIIPIFYLNNRSSLISSLGNYTYEMYLCGFVIQQLIVFLFGGTMNPYLNMLISIPIDLFIGYILAKYVKKLSNIMRKKG